MKNSPLHISTGMAEPLGLSFERDRANFALFSAHATAVILGLFWDEKIEEIPLERTGEIWHVAINGIPKGATYAYRCVGPAELLYNPNVWLADPYAKIMKDQIRAYVELPPPFDWQNIGPPQIEKQDLIIYEMHVRGFTKDPSSHVRYPGTYLGFIEKIPYLKELGVNAVELMPIFGFDETHTKNPSSTNYWGYDPLHFFVPNGWYAHEDPIREFKTLVRELHRNGILIFLDVVYNHSGEGKETDYYVHFRGIDNEIYYQLDEHKKYVNYSGCGNTLNVNHPIVQKLILDSLRYWATEMKVDGFRFDLASIFSRDSKGIAQERAPFIEQITQDPILSKTVLIAEPWDAAGLYQVGYFSKYGGWSEWNGPYRDTVRRFIKGTEGQAGPFAASLAGSEPIYSSSFTPLSSINFITAHDGYCLRDLVTYQSKYNWANGEENQDGTNQNDNWNCGHEGLTADPSILNLRERQMRNFLVALFVSQGIPQFVMHDTYGHTSYGNNNPYTQDNRINWFQWDQLEANRPIFQFIASLIAFRKNHSSLRNAHFLTDSDVTWMNSWDASQRTVVLILKNNEPLFIAFNANFKPAQLLLPPGNWSKVIDTKEQWQFHEKGEPLSNQVELAPYSSLIAIRTNLIP